MIGGGPAGIAAYHGLITSGFDVDIVCSKTDENKIIWANNKFVTQLIHGKLGNGNIWGSCIYKIPYKVLAQSSIAISNAEYEDSVKNILSLFSLKRLSFAKNKMAIYHHYKGNLFNTLEIKSILEKVRVDKVVRVEEIEGRNIVHFESGNRREFDYLVSCVPLPELLQLGLLGELEKIQANEHFMDISGQVTFEQLVSPQIYSRKLRNKSLRYHHDFDNMSIHLLPRFAFQRFLSNHHIVEIRRKFIHHYINKRYTSLIFTFLTNPISILSLILWYFRLHPKTKFFDCITAINRKTSVIKSHTSISLDLIGPDSLSLRERAKITSYFDKLNANVKFLEKPFFENSQHLSGLYTDELELDDNRKIKGKSIYLLGSPLLEFTNASNPTLTMMALTYHFARNIKHDS